jgi:hypothetical protein
VAEPTEQQRDVLEKIGARRKTRTTFGPTPEQKEKERQNERRVELLTFMTADFAAFAQYVKAGHTEAETQTLDRLINFMSEYRLLTQR